MARPRKEITFKELDSLCSIQCTEEEVAHYFQCSVDTINRRIQEAYGMTFSDYYAEKRGLGKISLRRLQWQTARKGNAQMQIFLGKNALGQRDRNTHEISGVDGKPIEFSDHEAAAKLAAILNAAKARQEAGIKEQEAPNDGDSGSEQS